MHSLLKQGADRLIERRQKDVQDQAENFAAAQTGNGNNMLSIVTLSKFFVSNWKSTVSMSLKLLLKLPINFT